MKLNDENLKINDVTKNYLDPHKIYELFSFYFYELEFYDSFDICSSMNEIFFDENNHNYSEHMLKMNE